MALTLGRKEGKSVSILQGLKEKLLFLAIFRARGETEYKERENGRMVALCQVSDRPVRARARESAVC